MSDLKRVSLSLAFGAMALATVTTTEVSAAPAIDTHLAPVHATQADSGLVQNVWWRYRRWGWGYRYHPWGYYRGWGWRGHRWCYWHPRACGW